MLQPRRPLFRHQHRQHQRRLRLRLPCRPVSSTSEARRTRRRLCRHPKKQSPLSHLGLQPFRSLPRQIRPLAPSLPLPLARSLLKQDCLAPLVCLFSSAWFSLNVLLSIVVRLQNQLKKRRNRCSASRALQSPLAPRPERRPLLRRKRPSLHRHSTLVDLLHRPPLLNLLRRNPRPRFRLVAASPHSGEHLLVLVRLDRRRCHRLRPGLLLATRSAPSHPSRRITRVRSRRSRYLLSVLSVEVRRRIRARWGRNLRRRSAASVVRLLLLEKTRGKRRISLLLRSDSAGRSMVGPKMCSVGCLALALARARARHHLSPHHRRLQLAVQRSLRHSLSAPRALLSRERQKRHPSRLSGRSEQGRIRTRTARLRRLAPLRRRVVRSARLRLAGVLVHLLLGLLRRPGHRHRSVCLRLLPISLQPRRRHLRSVDRVGTARSVRSLGDRSRSGRLMGRRRRVRRVCLVLGIRRRSRVVRCTY